MIDGSELKIKILNRDDLIPEGWGNSVDCWVFNPSIIKRSDAGYSICYRVVNKAGWRRVACAVLDQSLEPVKGSIVPLSDFLRFPDNVSYSDHTLQWHADPRLVELEARLYVTWNDGMPYQGMNHQFRIELDSASLYPIGRGKELQMTAPRRRFEKNWMFFEEDGLKIVYSINPLRIMKEHKSDGDTLLFTDLSRSFWNSQSYETKFGELRGGAPPVRLGSYFYSFCHSRYGGSKGTRYAASAVKFTAAAPFSIVAACLEPLPLPNPFGSGRHQKQLNANTDDIIYPCGAIIDGEAWILSYGINDEHCAFCKIPHDLIESLLTDISPASDETGHEFVASPGIRRLAWRATVDTFLKSGGVPAASLPEDEKAFAQVGSYLYADSAILVGSHCILGGATLNGSTLADRDWFIFEKHWTRT